MVEEPDPTVKQQLEEIKESARRSGSFTDTSSDDYSLSK
jgi:hypothetical protein